MFDLGDIWKELCGLLAIGKHLIRGPKLILYPLVPRFQIDKASVSAVILQQSQWQAPQAVSGIDIVTGLRCIRRQQFWVDFVLS